MDDVQTHIRQARMARRKFEFWVLMLYLAAQVILVILPIVYTALTLKVDNLPTLVSAVFVVVMVGLATIVGLGAYGVGNALRLANLDAIEEARKRAERRLLEEESLRAESESQLQAISGAMSVLQDVIAEEAQTTLEKDVERILAPIIAKRTETLGFRSDDLYNFAVYIFHPKTQKLYVFYRDCDNRIERHDRAWEKGVGHVGIAFAMKKTCVATDSTRIVGEFVHDQYESDAKFYRSFVSTPIINVNAKSDQPFGTLVITSSRKDHFDETYKSAVEVFANILSVYFSDRQLPDGEIDYSFINKYNIKKEEK